MASQSYPEMSPTQEPAQVQEGLLFLCEDDEVGIGPVLASFQNGSRSGAYALRVISTSLHSMIELGRTTKAQYVFPPFDRISVPASLIDKPKQRLEWVLLVNLIPLLANNEFASIHRKLVIVTLETIQSALLASEDASHSIRSRSTTARAKEFRLAVLHILQELISVVEKRELPQEWTVKQSAFKNLSDQEVDTPWISIHFSGMEDVLRVSCFLLSFLCSRYELDAWPLVKSEEEIRLGLMHAVCTLLQQTLPGNAFPSDDSPDRGFLATSRSTVNTLYQVCSDCIQVVMPLLSTDERLMITLARALAFILYSHVMAVQDRFKEWVASAPDRAAGAQVPEEADAWSADIDTVPENFKKFRTASQPMLHLEAQLIEAFQTVIGHILECSTDPSELYAIQGVLLHLLFTEELMFLSGDETGEYMQTTVIAVIGCLVKNGSMMDPSRIIDRLLSRFTHLESSVLVHAIWSCLECGRDPNSKDHQRADGFQRTSAIKRMIDDVDMDMDEFVGGKRAKIESPGYTPSAISTSSSIVFSQLSQRIIRTLGDPPPNVGKPPTEHLLDIFRKFVSFQTASYAASQGSRGVKPPLSVKDLKTMLVLVQVWARFVPSLESSLAVDSSTERLLCLMESIGKNYFLWAMSPGMQDADRNSKYLESSFPLLLKVIACLSTFPMVSSLRSLLIVLTSGPWYDSVTAHHLWHEMAMAMDDLQGEQELASAILAVVDGTEIQVRLRSDPRLLLQASNCFKSEKKLAMAILATLPFSQSLSVWRHSVLIQALNLTDDHESSLSMQIEDRSLQMTAIESLAVMSYHCPERLFALQSIARLPGKFEYDLDLMKLLASSLGAFACGHSLTDRQKLERNGSSFIFDFQQEQFVPRRVCPTCDTSSTAEAARKGTASQAATHLTPDFLGMFSRLGAMATTSELKIALLTGLYPVFCHLDLSSVEIQKHDLGTFVLSQLFDTDPHVAAVAGDFAELVATMAGEQITLHPLESSSVDGNLSLFAEAISNAISTRTWNKSFFSILQLCRRIMRRLPEDHPTYTTLLRELIDQSSKDPLRTDIVLQQLSGIARDKGLSNYRLLSPHIGFTCALVIDKLANNQEEWLQSIVSWTGLSQLQFLEKNCNVLLPNMVLVQRDDLIQKLAARLEMTPALLCIGNADSILACLFIQRDREVIAPCIECVRRVVHKGEGSDVPRESLGISELSFLCTPGLLLLLAVKLGDHDSSIRAQASSAIEAVKGIVCERDVDQDEETTLSDFLGRYILGILSDINNTVVGSDRDVCLGIKAQYLRCLRWLATLLDPIRRTILAQIFSPLIIALNSRELRLQSLTVMRDIIKSVPTEHLDELLAHVVSTLTAIYPLSASAEKALVQDILEFLVFDCQEKLADALKSVGTLPSLPNFRDMNQVLSSLKRQEETDKRLSRLIERSRHENVNLAAQALQELKDFLLANEQFVLDMAFQKSDEINPILYELIQMLLSGIGRHKGLDTDVPRRCIECLGLVGAINPAKLARSQQTAAKTVYPNFNDMEDARNFVCELIQAQLVGRGRSIGDVHSESRWAFALQSLLSFCGITKVVLVGPEPLPRTQTAIPASQSLYHASTKRVSVRSPKERWYEFPRHVRDVLELFIDAKYSKDGATAASEMPCPLFPDVKTFQMWITLWTRRLISKVRGQIAREIFLALKHVALNDTNTCQYILPHLVLNVLLEGSEQDRSDIVKEMAAVLGPGKDWRDENTPLTAGMPKQSTSELYQLGSQAVFTLLDHISNWIQSCKTLNVRGASQRSFVTTSAEPSQSNMRPTSDAALARMQNHLGSISNDVIARASFRCHAYARALFHYEQNIRDLRTPVAAGPKLSETTLQSMYEELQEIYINLQEPDGMAGISHMITSGTTNQHLLQCESAGRWSEAQAYYELALETEPTSIKNHVGLYNSLENLGKFETMLMGVQGDITLNPEWEATLNNVRIGAAWKLQSWETLEQALSRPHQDTFETGVGQLLLDLRDNRVADFDEHMQSVRSMLIAPLAAASMESYSRAYDSMVKVHMLHELEVAFRTWSTEDGDGSLVLGEAKMETSGQSYSNRLDAYESRLAQRLEILAPTFKVREQALRLRRIAFYDLRASEPLSKNSLDFLKQGSGQIWMQTAKLARQSGNDQIAFGAMLQAEQLQIQSALIERVKWGYAHQNEQQATQAIDSALTRSLALSEAEITTRTGRTGPNSVSRLRSTAAVAPRSWNVNSQLERAQDWTINTNDIGFIRSKAVLLRTRWQEKSNVVSISEIADGYRQTVVECDRWEKGYYYLGQYYFRVFDLSRRSKLRHPNYNSATNACRMYGRALTLGPKYLYQILPRLLTFWLDLGQQYKHVAPNSAGMTSAQYNAQTSLNTEFLQINGIMESLTNCLPVYMFLSAFPQIISRICHKNADAFQVLQHIILSVVLVYPDQAIWQMVSLSRSIVPERKRVCNKILDSIQFKPKTGSAMMDRIKEALDLCDSLIALCMAPVPDKVSKLSLEKHFTRISRQLKSRFNVMVPLQLTLWPTLPESSKTLASHQPFPTGLPRIEGFRDEVEVMSSLQKPRKITMIGSDGKNYTFLCKPKDDLRKDAKVMEFNQLVNTLLRKNREANKRNLYIRTYAVVPLNEECGLIEWVHNTLPYRHIIHRQYKVQGINTPPIPEIRRMLDQDDHVNIFTKELTPKFPPIFYQWFKDISPDPTTWFAIRLQYTRTTAVMSMVGHILGLGDRHGENLLFDERNGDLVHVDFNCLFELGKTFPKPERVPFRLTHNMVDAMGLSKTEGVFQTACEVTLKVFRANAESLTSVLEGFVHDPLVEWSKTKRRGQQHQLEGAGGHGGDDPDTVQAEMAQSTLLQVRKKLSGQEPNVNSTLSVKGQVQELIQVATSPKNLAKMYIGWSAYM